MVYYLGETQSKFCYAEFQIHEDPEGYPAINNETVFRTYTDGVWSNSDETENINPFPFRAGNNFTLTFHVLDQTSLQVTYPPLSPYTQIHART